jgi:uncharacterized membrane protein YgdD (TMEM256/DUF423 family)
MANPWIVMAGLGGFVSVAAGAAAAHVTAGDAHATALIDTASRYLMVHSLALLAVALLGRGRMLAIAGGLFAVGMSVFAGGLITLAITGWPVAAMATPVGGTTLLAGWLVLAGYGALRVPTPNPPPQAGEG